MTEEQAEALMAQIVKLHGEWAAGGLSPNTERGARLQNRLFSIAKKIDPDRMSAAFEAGLRRHPAAAMRRP